MLLLPAVMTVVISSERTGRISVAGSLRGEAVGALASALAGLGSSLVLDLTDLRGFDGPGERLLRRLQADGVRLTGLSPYLTLVLDSPGGALEPPDSPTPRRNSLP